MLKEWLGSKPGFKGLFANTFGRGKVLIGISENIQAMEIIFSAEEMETLNNHFSPGVILGATYLQR